MHRFMVVPLAGLLALAVAAPVAAGAQVSNQSGTFDEAYGSWSSYDEATEIATYGEVFVAQESGGPGFVEYLFEETGTYVPCDSAEGGIKGVSPEDTGGGESYGFVGTRSFGWGEATLTVGRRLSTATASGTVFVEIDSIDECAGIYDVVSSGEAGLELALTGVGDLVSFKSSSSIKIPGSLNGHSSYKGHYRAATGTVDFGAGVRTLEWAQIAHVGWTDHCNGGGCGY